MEPQDPRLPTLLRAALGAVGIGALSIAAIWIKEVELESEPGAWWVPAAFLITGTIMLQSAATGRQRSARAIGVLAALVAVGCLVYLMVGLSGLQ